jgi:penicillin-binding protein 1A
MVDDHPINLAQPGQPDRLWPTNHYGSSRGMMTIDNAIANSVNTVAVKVISSVTLDASFNFLKNDLNFHSLVENEVTASGRQSDRAIAPLAIGAMTYGVTPLEMAGGYQIFANGGNFTTPYAYTKVVDQNGKVILEPDTTPRQVIGEDTSVVLNKLLQRVVTSGWGTGGSANLGTTMPTAGKTGTSEWDIDQWFIGLTPYHVCQVWLGFDTPQELKVNPNTGTRQWVKNTIGYNNYPPPLLWKTIMQPISEKLDPKPFLESDDVVSATFCQITGNLATSACPSTGVGWYKRSRMPPTCTGNHVISLPGSGDSEDGERPTSPLAGTRPAPILADEDCYCFR